MPPALCTTYPGWCVCRKKGTSAFSSSGGWTNSDGCLAWLCGVVVWSSHIPGDPAGRWTPVAGIPDRPESFPGSRVLGASSAARVPRLPPARVPASPEWGGSSPHRRGNRGPVLKRPQKWHTMKCVWIIVWITSLSRDTLYRTPPFFVRTFQENRGRWPNTVPAS